jgi:hypothetical protein
MAEWKRTIDIKQHLDADKPLAEVRDPIVAILKADRAYRSAVDRYLFGDSFKDITDNLADAEDVEAFNDWLSALYDWADENRVWIGGEPAYHDA